MKRKSTQSSFWSRYYEKPNVPHPLTVRSLGYNRIPPSYNGNTLLKHPYHHWFDPKTGRKLSTLTVVHVFRGGGRFRSKASGTLPIPVNSIFVVLPNVRHSYAYDHETGWDNEWLEVEADGLSNLLTSAGISESHPIHKLGDFSRVSTEFRSLFALARHENDPALIAAQAYRVLATIIHEVAHPTQQRTSVGILRNALEKFNDYPQPISELSRISGMSASGLRAAFKSQVGISPIRYRARIKLEAARQLLLSGTLPIASIATECGYRAQSTFTKCFRREYGQTPTAYRRQHTLATRT